MKWQLIVQRKMVCCMSCLRLLRMKCIYLLHCTFFTDKHKILVKMKEEIIFLLACFILIKVGIVKCEFVWMCDDQLPKNIECDDTQQHIVIDDIQFQSVPHGGICGNNEDSPSRQADMQTSMCRDENVMFAANQLCSGKSQCELTRIGLWGKLCKWPENKRLKIQYTCHSKFVCNAAVNGLKANCYTKNLHERPAAWARDAKWHVDSIFLLPWVKHGATRTLYEYPSLDRFEVGWPFVKYHLPDAASSTSMTLSNGMMFYVKHETRKIIKYSVLRRQKIAERKLPNAYYNGEASYVVSEGGGSDIDLAVDEVGLWAIYSTAANNGNVVISQIDTDDLSVTKTWTTNVRKSSLMNAFVVCGEVYFINNQREIFEKFVTASNTSAELPKSESMTLPWQSSTSVNYNPRDNMLYVWSLQQAMMFTLFNIKTPTQETTVKRFQHHTLKTSVKVHQKNSTSVTTFTSTFTTKSFNRNNNASCPSVTRNQITFPSVPANTQLMISCPNQPHNMIQWECVLIGDNLAEWNDTGPDFTKCLEWTKDIKNDVENSNSMQASNKLLEAVRTQQVLNSVGGLTNVDIQTTAKLMKELSKPDKTSTAQECLHVYENLLATGNELMNSNLTTSWQSMDELDKSNAFSNIMDTLEASAFQYAGKLLVNNQHSKLTLESESVAMSVQVIDTTSSKHEQPIVFSLGNSSSEIDTIELSSADVKTHSENGASKVVFAIYKNFGELLNHEHNAESLSNVALINSHIVSVSLTDNHQHINLLEPVKLTLKHRKNTNEKHSCVFWKPGNSTSVGSWSTSGCSVTMSNATHTQCECDHLTSFAVLINHQDFVLSETHSVALDYITWIGLTTSLICLALSIATFTFFKPLHCLRTTIHTNLCICLFVSQLTFLTAIDLYDMEIVCSVVAGVLHYTFLATFTWMALEGFQLYVMLVEVFERFTSVVWYYLIGYGLPAIFVAISASINHQGYGTDTACWLSTELGGNAAGLMPFIWAFIGPASFVAVANIFFLVLTAVTIYTHARKYIYFSKIRAAKSSLCGTCALLCLLGSTWIFGIVWWWKHLIVIHYLFCIFNAFQGVYVFLFHCILHNKVRYEYRNFLSQCFGEKYFDNTTTTSLSVKYNGSRRRSSHTHYQQKWRRDSSSKSSAKPFIYEKHVQAKQISKRRKSAPSIESVRRDHGSMQAIVTRKNSITYLHPRLKDMFSTPDNSQLTTNISQAQGGAFFAQRHYSMADRHSMSDIKCKNNDSTKRIMTRHSMKAVVNNCSKLVQAKACDDDSSSNHESPDVKFHSMESLLQMNENITRRRTDKHKSMPELNTANDM